MSGKKLIKRHHRHAMACFLFLAVLAVLIVVLYLLYRPIPPRVVATPVEISLDEFSVVPPALRLSSAVHVVVYNPSRSPYRYGERVTAVTYHGEPVGSTVVPAGEVQGLSTSYVEPPTVVDGVKVAANEHFLSDALAGALPFVAGVRLDGKALVMRTFEVSVTVEVVCYVQLYVLRGESSSHCVSSVHVGPGS